VKTIVVASDTPLPGYPRPLWIDDSYQSEGKRIECLRCRMTTEPGMTERERFDFELLHSLCPAPTRPS